MDESGSLDFMYVVPVVVNCIRAVSQLLWSLEDREVWFSLRENHERVYRLPYFLPRSTGREQLCATFLKESRMQFGGSTNIHRKYGFGLHQLRKCSSEGGQ
jgi:hypothetical protein